MSNKPYLLHLITVLCLLYFTSGISQIALIESTPNYYNHHPIQNNNISYNSNYHEYNGNNTNYSTYSNIETVPQVNWLEDFDQALNKARQENKKVVMYFMGSDWCSPCKLLKKDFFDTLKFKTMAQKVVLLKVDIPRRIDIISPEQLAKNKTLVNRYNPSKGFPCLVAIDHYGNSIAKHSAYSMSLRDPQPYFLFMESIID